MPIVPKDLYQWIVYAGAVGALLGLVVLLVTDFLVTGKSADKRVELSEKRRTEELTDQKSAYETRLREQREHYELEVRALRAALDESRQLLLRQSAEQEVLARVFVQAAGLGSLPPPAPGPGVDPQPSPARVRRPRRQP